jgi:predicted nuclease with TOPRIM domain
VANERDTQVQNHIEELVAEEHELLKAGQEQEGLSPEQHERLRQVKVELDRYWDLLRQRQAHEEFGLDPDNTSMRDDATVEGYEG